MKMVTETINIRSDVNEKNQNILIKKETLEDEKNQIIKEKILIAEPEIT